MGCNQRFFSLLFEHARCWIADCCLFALRLGYEIKSLYLLLELYVFVCAWLFVLVPKYNFYVWKFCVQVCVLWFLWGFLTKFFLELLYPCKYQRVSGSSSVVETKKWSNLPKKGKNELITQIKLYLSHLFIPVKQ